MSVELMQQFKEKTDTPAIVRFTREAVQDKAESLKQGKWVGKDVDMVHITPPYSKEEIDKKVTAWLEQNEAHVSSGKMAPERRDRYRAEYEAWKQGQELPVEGTPIKGWGMLSPAEQELLVSLKIYTVESLSRINDVGMKMVGMGAMDMKGKAAAWLAQNRDKGPLTMKIASVESENRALKMEMSTMRTQLEQLKVLVQAQSMHQPVVSHTPVVPPTPAPVDDIGHTPPVDFSKFVDPEPPQEPMAQQPPTVVVTPSNGHTEPEKPKRHRRTKAEMDAARQSIPANVSTQPPLVNITPATEEYGEI